MLAKHDPEVIDEAVRLIHASGGRHYEDADLDAVPFSVDGNGLSHQPPGSSIGGQFAPDKGGDAGGSSKKNDPITQRSKARPIVPEKDKHEINKWTKRLGIRISDVPSLVGASNSAKVELSSVAHGLQVVVNHPLYRCRRILRCDRKGTPYIFNDKITVDEEHQRRGIGARIFARQVHHAANAGFHSVRANLVRSEKDNGYYTWALLGYNQEVENLDDRIANAILAEFPGVADIHELMQAEGGAEWWHKNGGSFFGTFELREGSDHRFVLDDYMKYRAKTPPKGI